MDITGIFNIVTVQAIFLKIFQAALLFLAGRFIINLLYKGLSRFFEKKKFNPMLQSFALSMAKFLLMFMLIIYIIDIFTDATSLVAILGAASLAIGLALQKDLSNFASGVMILIFRPFKIGDFVDVAGVQGNVNEIGIFHSILCTMDNKKIIIPNSSVTSSNIVNYTGNHKRRVDLIIGVSYNSKIPHVKEAITQVVTSHEKVLKKEPVTVRVISLNSSSVDFTVRVWVKTKDYWDVYFDLLENIKTKLDEEKISIPYPHVTVEMKK